MYIGHIQTFSQYCEDSPYTHISHGCLKAETHPELTLWRHYQFLVSDPYPCHHLATSSA